MNALSPTIVSPHGNSLAPARESRPQRATVTVRRTENLRTLPNTSKPRPERAPYALRSAAPTALRCSGPQRQGRVPGSRSSTPLPHVAFVAGLCPRVPFYRWLNSSGTPIPSCCISTPPWPIRSRGSSPNVTKARWRSERRAGGQSWQSDQHSGACAMGLRRYVPLPTSMPQPLCRYFGPCGRNEGATNACRNYPPSPSTGGGSDGSGGQWHLSTVPTVLPCAGKLRSLCASGIWRAFIDG